MSSNPLFVVTNKGKDVEQADSWWDMVVKKLGLAPVLEILNKLLMFILEQAKTYAWVVLANELVNLLVKLASSLLPVERAFAWQGAATR